MFVVVFFYQDLSLGFFSFVLSGHKKSTSNVSRHHHSELYRHQYRYGNRHRHRHRQRRRPRWHRSYSVIVTRTNILSDFSLIINWHECSFVRLLFVHSFVHVWFHMYAWLCMSSHSFARFTFEIYVILFYSRFDFFGFTNSGVSVWLVFVVRMRHPVQWVFSE